ncbi:MAG: response regulator transcription factor [Fluviicola sp.]
MAEKIRIILVDDHKLVTEGWTALLSLDENLSVVGTANSAEAALDLCLSLLPDVVLMDVNLHNSNGMDATEMICNRIAKIKVIGLSLHDDIAIVKSLMSKGARGYLSKNSSRAELIHAINSVMSGSIYLGENIRDKLFNETFVAKNEDSIKELTLKEIEIVKGIANGLTSKQMAENLFVSVRTIETHRHNILKKLKLQNAAQLSSWSRDHGYF